MIASLNAQRQMHEFSRRRIYMRLRRQGPGLDRDGEETYYEMRWLRKRVQLRRDDERNKERDPDGNEARSK